MDTELKEIMEYQGKLLEAIALDVDEIKQKIAARSHSRKEAILGQFSHLKSMMNNLDPTGKAGEVFDSLTEGIAGDKS